MRALLLAALLAGPAVAQQPCPAKPAAGWGPRVPISAALTPAALSAAVLRIGQAADVALAPAGTLRFAADPGRKPAQDSRGGLVAFDVSKAGTYRVGLSAGAWIDVLRDGAATASTAHGHGPACSGIRKTVDFALTPGRYVLQLSGSAEPKVTVLVAAVG